MDSKTGLCGNSSNLYTSFTGAFGRGVALVPIKLFRAVFGKVYQIMSCPPPPTPLHLFAMGAPRLMNAESATVLLVTGLESTQSSKATHLETRGQEL